MDYRSFNVRAWSFLRVRKHTGVGQSNNESAQHLDSEKNSYEYVLSWWGSNLGSLDLECVDALPIEPPLTPVTRAGHKYKIVMCDRGSQ